MGEYKAVLNGALRQEFQKDLQLFKYFLLLLNNSSPIRNVELVWADEVDLLGGGWNERVDTSSALVQLQPVGSESSMRSSPSTRFCDLVHGFGAHESTTCAKSDNSAKQLCRRTEHTQVYPCHIGLTDIAVPVICDGQYLGTLFSGQVLQKQPTQEDYLEVRRILEPQHHIDFEELERAYYQVPIVTKDHIADTVRVLELFARYIANSWKRLQIISKQQLLKGRELALNRKELAALLLSGSLQEVSQLKALAAEVGLRRLPDRVMVLRTNVHPESDEEHARAVSHITLNRITHLVEDMCQTWPNTLTTASGHGEISIFTNQEGRNESHQHLSLQEKAESVLAGLRLHGFHDARIGIGGGTTKTDDILRSYQEACGVLDTQNEAICFSKVSGKQKKNAELSLAPIVQALQRGEKLEGAVREFLASAIPQGSGYQNLQQSRATLTWAVEHLTLEVISMGVDRRVISEKKGVVVVELINNSNPFSLCESVRKYVEFLRQHVVTTFSQREHKVVTSVARLVEKYGAASVTIQFLAEILHLSPGHLSRIYSRTTGMTLEEYLIRRRIDLAKRMLLDPRLNVAEVSDRCGFCNPAYFASVFKKYMQCTPREFARCPYMWGGEGTAVIPANAN